MPEQGTKLRPIGLLRRVAAELRKRQRRRDFAQAAEMVRVHCKSGDVPACPWCERMARQLEEMG
jgi:hypothetical protein